MGGKATRMRCQLASLTPTPTKARAPPLVGAIIARPYSQRTTPPRKNHQRKQKRAKPKGKTPSNLALISSIDRGNSPVTKNTAIAPITATFQSYAAQTNAKHHSSSTATTTKQRHSHKTSANASTVSIKTLAPFSTKNSRSFIPQQTEMQSTPAFIAV